MRMHKQFFKSIALTTLLTTGFAAYVIAQDKTTIVDSETNAPVILTTSPNGGDMNVDLGSVIEITFSQDMDEKSINGTTLLLRATNEDSMQHEEHSEMMLDDEMKDRSAMKDSENGSQSTADIKGTISYSNKVAVFTPDEELKEGTEYTFTVTSDVKSSDNIPLKNEEKLSFKTSDTSDSNYTQKQDQKQDEKQDEKYRSEMGENDDRSQKASSTNKTKLIELGKAGHFVILAKKYVNNESGSKIKGNTGEGSLENGTKREKEKVTQQSNTDQDPVTQQQQTNQSDTASANINEGIKDMMSAYADASLQYGEDATTHDTKSFHHNPVLAPGVHEWSDSLQITSDVTLSGSAEDVWLFKAGKNLTVKENTVFTLTDGAQADNVFWFVEGEVTIGENAQFEGIILSVNEITLEKGAEVNGRIFSQMSVTLNDNTITEPRSMTGQTTSKNK